MYSNLDGRNKPVFTDLTPTGLGCLVFPPSKPHISNIDALSGSVHILAPDFHGRIHIATWEWSSWYTAHESGSDVAKEESISFSLPETTVSERPDEAFVILGSLLNRWRITSNERIQFRQTEETAAFSTFTTLLERARVYNFCADAFVHGCFLRRVFLT